MLRITLLGVGGQGIKTAEHIIGRVAFLHGYNVQDQPLYGAERRGTPVFAFIRISNTKILSRGYIDSTDFLVVADYYSLLRPELHNFLKKIKKGGIIFFNTVNNEHKVREEFNISDTTQIVIFDLDSMAKKILNSNVLSSGLAGAVCKILDFDLTRLEEAIKIETEEILSSDEHGNESSQLNKNIELAKSTFQSLSSSTINKRILSRDNEYDDFEDNKIISLQNHHPNISKNIITNTGNTMQVIRKGWNLFKPIIDYDKCTKCRICFVYCPDSAITIDKQNFPQVNYNFCKSCNICYTECPVNAIDMKRKNKID